MIKRSLTETAEIHVVIRLIHENSRDSRSISKIVVLRRYMPKSLSPGSLSELFGLATDPTTPPNKPPAQHPW
jgi:hypothetical protein